MPSIAKSYIPRVEVVRSKPIELLTDKTFRVFASTNSEDGYIGKMKDYNATLEKFAGTSEHMFILNGDIKGVKIPERLNKQWYIDLAYERLKQFGVI